MEDRASRLCANSGAYGANDSGTTGSVKTGARK